jgi:hypothetical protein
MAEASGCQWKPAADVAQMALANILDRVDSTVAGNGQRSAVRREAMPGGANNPGVIVSAALESCWPVVKDKVADKNSDQVRVWRNPCIKACKNFIEVVGDIPLAEITTDHLLDVRDWWGDRVETEGVDPPAANKDFICFGSVVKTVAQMRCLGFVPPVDGLAFKRGKQIDARLSRASISRTSY